MVLVAMMVGTAWAGQVVDAVGVDVGNHSIAFPFGQLGRFSPVYPSVGVSAEHDWVAHGAFTLAQEARVGVFRHGLVGTSATVGTDVVARLTAGSGPMVEAGLGVGASDSWRARDVLAWDEELGTYTTATDWGRAGFLFGFTLGAGFDLSEVSDVPLTPSVQYRWFAQAPFLPAIGAGPQGILSVGLSWTLGGDS